MNWPVFGEKLVEIRILGVVDIVEFGALPARIRGLVVPIKGLLFVSLAWLCVAACTVESEPLSEYTLHYVPWETNTIHAYDESHVVKYATTTFQLTQSEHSRLIELIKSQPNSEMNIAQPRDYRVLIENADGAPIAAFDLFTIFIHSENELRKNNQEIETYISEIAAKK